MDCFQDFCLACDNASNGVYCSQACRLVDLERANSTLSDVPSSPTSQHHSRFSSSSSSSSSTSASVYVLPPAFDFTDRTTASPSFPPYRSQTTSFMRSPAQPPAYQGTPSRSLTPSSSRTSLTSTTSTTSPNGVSDEARVQLESYFNSFTQARASKRRPSH